MRENGVGALYQDGAGLCTKMDQVMYQNGAGLLEFTGRGNRPQWWDFPDPYANLHESGMLFPVLIGDRQNEGRGRYSALEYSVVESPRCLPFGLKVAQNVESSGAAKAGQAESQTQSRRSSLVCSSMNSSRATPTQSGCINTKCGS